MDAIQKQLLEAVAGLHEIPGGDLYMFRTVSAFTLSVCPDVVGSHRDFMQPGNCL